MIPAVRAVSRVPPVLWGTLFPLGMALGTPWSHQQAWKFPWHNVRTSIAIHFNTAGRLPLCSAMQDVLVLVSCLCTTGAALHEPHAATGAERLVVLLHVICTQRSATDAAQTTSKFPLRNW